MFALDTLVVGRIGNRRNCHEHLRITSLTSRLSLRFFLLFESLGSLHGGRRDTTLTLPLLFSGLFLRLFLFFRNERGWLLTLC